MNINKVSCILIVLILMSCKTVSIQSDTQKLTANYKVLGSVGEQKDFVLEKSYNNTALPNYEHGIKIEVISASFSKATFKAFQKAKVSQKTTIAINYVDSVEIKPQFLKLELADRVAVINALNGKQNRDVKGYLLNKEESHIVSGVSIVLNQEDFNVLVKADEVFLEQEGLKSYALKSYKNSQLQKTILFNQGVVFAYKTSSFCWQEDDKYQLQIVDLAESNNRCPKRTFKSAKNAEKKIDYFKF